MRYRNLLALPLSVTVALPAAANDFSCRNDSAEIRCADGACTLAPPGEFTPMQLDRTGNRLTACVYSACWSGAVQLRRTRGAIDLIHADMTNQQTRERAGLAVIFDRQSRSAQVRFLGFSNAMGCGGTPRR